ncbi:MAG: ABC transporter ATP-binding protein [Caldilineaceae bacterium]|nr:ABC transporter ATP-binding protein [Caldilineaceae bacterium]
MNSTPTFVSTGQRSIEDLFAHGISRPTAGHRAVNFRLNAPYVQMYDIVKRFPGVLACDHVDFDVRRGEVHALLGENGAGKSTLMKVLYGLYQPEEGRILRDGAEVTIHSPTDAIHQGIGMIHQHFMLVDTLTVTENVALGLKSSRGLLLDLDRVEEGIRELSEAYGLQLDPNAPVWTLSVGERQRVEIMKALYRGAALLILDEPTAVLTPQEVEELFVTLRYMKENGYSLVFISHKLQEVLAISDRITVMREGRRVGTVSTQEMTRSELARMMVGRDVILEQTRDEVEVGDVRLRLQDVSARGVTGQQALRDVSLSVKSGEILGVAGISGNGQRELAEVVAGLRPLSGGTVEMDGDAINDWTTARRTENGLAYIPEERMHDGIVRDFAVSENLVLQEHTREPFSHGIFLAFEYIARYSRKLIQDFYIKTPDIRTMTRNLSGGNIQRLIVARELSRQPKVLVAAQPTRGIDIGAIEYIYSQILEQRDRGAAILLISEDLDELLALCDRIAVIFEGSIMDILDRKETTAEELGLLMAGVDPANREAAQAGIPAVAQA